VDQLGGVALQVSAVLLIAVAAVRLSVGSGLPSLLLYLGLGLLIGERGLGLRFDDAELTGLLGYAALIVILAEGGLTTRWERIRVAVWPAALLATVGTAVSVTVVGAATVWLFDLDWTTALLLGAVVTSTDAAAVFSVLRRIPLPGRLVGILEAESGFNDAPVVILVVALTAEALDGGGAGDGWGALVLLAFVELAIGAVVGLAVGRLGAGVLRRVALPSSGLYPITVVALAFCAYGAADVLHGSGFLATYLAALVLGNVRLPHGAAVRGFAEGLGWIAQIGLFVLLGLLADPFRLPGVVLEAVVIGLVLLLVARPLSVLASVVWFRVRWREQVFLSWAGLRGAVPVVLATVPLSQGVDGATRIFDLVLVLVVVFTLVQGPTLGWVARRLRIGDSITAVDLDVESSPLGALDADVVQVRIGPTSRLHGVEVFELRLPSRANVTLVVRDGEPFVPGPRTMLRHGDDLIIVTAASVRADAVRRIREVSTVGKLAGWHREPPPATAAQQPPRSPRPVRPWRSGS
jgi:cell volume regulation protein A